MDIPLSYPGTPDLFASLQSESSPNNAPTTSSSSSSQQPAPSLPRNSSNSSAGKSSSRKKETHAPALSRNQACKTCRSRKVRCDAVRPKCGACLRSAKAQGKSPDQASCEYDAPEEPSPNVRKASGPVTDGSGSTQASTSAPSSKRARTDDAGYTQSGAGFGWPTVSDNSMSVSSAAVPTAAPQAPSISGSSARQSPTSLFPPRGSEGIEAARQNIASGSGPTSVQAMDDNSFFDLFWPNWPASLPSPKLVYSLAEVYFSKKFMAEGLISKQAFFANLALPPEHPDFPHVALIHAVCAIATKFVTSDTFGLDKETYWQSEATPADFHATASKRAIDSAVANGEKLVHIAQAIILICFYSYSSARFVEVWLYCGLATRICSPLGLTHLEAQLQAGPPGSMSNARGLFVNGKNKGGALPSTEEEKAEKASIFWMAFTADRLAAACTGWASSLAEDEISTLLPKATFERGPLQPITDQELEQLSLSSETFFTSNSSPLVGPTQLQFKSVVLLGRVCSFLRSAPWPVGADVIRYSRNERKPGGKNRTVGDIPNSSEFKRLDALIVAFRLSFPKECKSVLRRDNAGSVETNLVSAHVIPHASTILLHEPFVVSESDVSMQRCLTSARAILSIIYLLWGSSYDISLLQPFITFCWAVAGRTLVRELAFKQEAQDELGSATLTQEINVILAAMTAFADRSPLGLVVADSLKVLLANPEICHPRNSSGIAFLDVCDRIETPSSGTPAASRTTSTSGATPGASTSASHSLGTSGSNGTPGTPMLSSFSNMLWELEQPGVEFGQGSVGKMEDDLRNILGASYDQLLGAGWNDLESPQTSSL